jgi:predicted AAA+ superfamily ATPase
MKTDNRQNNLFKALGNFIEAMRPYIIALLSSIDKNWAQLYYDSLSPNQKENWNHNIKTGSTPQTLIDFHNLKGFSLKYKDLLKKDFPQDFNKLPTWFEEIADVRHKCNHYQQLEDDDYQRPINNMRRIARILNMTELENEIARLSLDKPAEKQVKPTPHTGPIPWFLNVMPHLDIRHGHLDESIFAANLAEVVLQSGREVYKNPAQFFEKTYFTEGLKTITRRVIQGLNGGGDGENRVISLQTGFGGGKTHALITLYHIAQGGDKLLKTGHLPPELIESTGAPQFTSAHTAVFTNKTCDPTQGRQVDGLQINTPWGELAYQLGGRETYQLIAENDRQRTAPKGLFKKVLEKTAPNLILIDELADYCIAASGTAVGSSTLSDQTISFVQELTEAVTEVDRSVLVATLPASITEIASSPQANRILTSLSSRLSRVSADTKPVSDEEIYEVIRLRLFERLGDPEQIETVITSYMNHYREHSDDLPPIAARGEYRRKLEKSYPFHPELIDIFRGRWASHHDFQRTRGVLRILASIVSDLWKRQGSLPGPNSLIHTSDINIANLDALREQLKKLYGNGYEAVMDADAAGSSANAFKIDAEKPEYHRFNIAQGVAGTILMGSFGGTGANKGISLQELKLCVLKPNAFNHNLVNSVLDALESCAHYLYYTTTGGHGKRYWFYTQPNINILINQAKNEIQPPQIYTEITRKISTHANRVNTLNILVDPADEIPEQKKPTLVILNPQHAANPEDIDRKLKPYLEKLATKKGGSERIYRNTMLFLTCTEIGLAKLSEHTREHLACKKIDEEYHSQLEPEQRTGIKQKINESEEKVDSALVSAYAIIAKYIAKQGIDKLVVRQFREKLDHQIDDTIYRLLKEEEWLLEGIGIGTLKNNNLFPTIHQPIRVKDLYEAFIRFDDKKMITSAEAIKKSLLNYYHREEYAIATGEPPEFTKIYYKEELPYFEVSDDSYWLVDKTLYQPEPAPPDLGSEDDNTSGPIPPPPTTHPQPPQVKTYKTITISGKVDIANYSHIFSGLIDPLRDNDLEIEITIKGKSTRTAPLTEDSDSYRITRETAYQLDLTFDREE